LSYLQSVIDTKTSGKQALDFLETNGFGHLTGTLFRSDHNYPIFRFDEQMQRDIDPQSFSAYALSHGRSLSENHRSLLGKNRAADDRAGKTSGQKAPPPQTPER
jgi:hypothetical protein